MIERLVVKGFRILRDFEWCPQEGANILVGDNASGKSTVLDALELVLGCRIDGKRASEELTPYWFNVLDVKEFFSALDAGDSSCQPPSILIEAYLGSTSGELARTSGLNNSKNDDSAGLKLEVTVEDDLLCEFFAACREERSGERLLPVEYYTIKWSIFQGGLIRRSPNGLVCTRIDSTPAMAYRSADGFARSIVDENLSAEELRSVSGSYRNLRQEIDDAILSKMLGFATAEERFKDVGLQMDQSSRSDWRNSIVLQRAGIPLSQTGTGFQVETKAFFALQKSAETKVLLMEEPENHLSHTSLTRLLGMVGNQLGDRQLFVTTHSAFVLNRLGLDRLALVNEGRGPIGISGLKRDTVRFFQKQSGVDTLRIVLSEKVVIVEGPSDEMVFNWEYEKRFGKEPREDGIDVIAYGVSGKRALELAHALGKGKMAVLRDNDETEPSKWISDAAEFLEDGKRQMFVSELGMGKTLEPQMVSANRDKLDTLKKVLGLKTDEETSMAKEMESKKTEWAWRLASADTAESYGLSVPSYFTQAIDFITSHE